MLVLVYLCTMECCKDPSTAHFSTFDVITEYEKLF